MTGWKCGEFTTGSIGFEADRLGSVALDCRLFQLQHNFCVVWKNRKSRV